MPKLTVTFSNAPPPNEPLMSDQPGSSSVPCTLSRKLNNEELRSYLHARYSDLGELLLPHADGDLLYLITVKPSRRSDAIATVSGYFFPGASSAFSLQPRFPHITRSCSRCHPADPL